ncbi:AAA family ATPase [Mycolicibacterium rhodesiae]|uniref:ATP-binding protein n=1 Tax=Mycolicibacterium rhodesiae TaxID=36814 RepID=A0A1X0IZT5_MYCRH|nr:AAA family ATPase [Mycolicibacterium rhodesiae]MCV7345073.1 AAA family ATPase [Mycolicibacterium rhodesiae]ORB54719.1 ATP-binding protein [Mycolicibacterium rhodesiae]
MLDTVAVENYRSLRRLIVPLRGLNVVTGANGAGKSSLYRALRLLADSARNGAVSALAREGGLSSTMWAGPGMTGPVSLKLGFAGEDFGYAVDFGLPQETETAFNLDPEIKSEAVWAGATLRPSALLAQRSVRTVLLRDADDGWHPTATLRPFDSMLSEVADPQAAPELLALRERVRSWRFYDHVRTDSDAPARQPQIGTRTMVLSHDGADLAAALQTIAEIGDAAALAEAVDNAFPGSRVQIRTEGRFEVTLRQPGMLRALTAAELSDGTLRYLLWVAALLTPRPAELTVLNEPESSLHPDLLPALAALIARSSERTQIVVVTHSAPLVEALRRRTHDINAIELTKEQGQTAIVGQGLLDEPSWHWPTRG